MQLDATAVLPVLPLLTAAKHKILRGYKNVSNKWQALGSLVISVAGSRESPGSFPSYIAYLRIEDESRRQILRLEINITTYATGTRSGCLGSVFAIGALMKDFQVV